MRHNYLSQDPMCNSNTDSIFKSFQKLDECLLSTYFKLDTLISFAKNDCIDFSSDVNIYSSNAALSIDVIELIKSEIGTELTELERKVVLIDKDLFNSSVGMMVIYKGVEGRRVKINLFLNKQFKIEYITLYKSTCNYF